jgi:GNAT superfamily N-acetyltransferase
MALSPRSLAHALHLNVESPRLRLRRTEMGERALHFEAPQREPLSARAPTEDLDATPNSAALPPQPAPRRRFIDDPIEVGWRHGLLRAAREGYDHFIPDEPRAAALADAFGPLEPLRVMGERGPEDLPALKLTAETRARVLAGRLRFAAADGPDAGGMGAELDPSRTVWSDAANPLFHWTTKDFDQIAAPRLLGREPNGAQRYDDVFLSTNPKAWEGRGRLEGDIGETGFTDGARVMPMVVDGPLYRTDGAHPIPSKAELRRRGYVGTVSGEEVRIFPDAEGRVPVRSVFAPARPDGGASPADNAPNAGRAPVITDEALDGGRRVLGYEGVDGGLTYSPKDYAWIVGTVRLPGSERGQGLGVRLYESLIERARAAGVSEIRSDASVNQNAQRIYDALQRRGYRVTRADGPRGPQYRVSTEQPAQRPNDGPSGEFPKFGAGKSAGSTVDVLTARTREEWNGAGADLLRSGALKIVQRHAEVPIPGFADLPRGIAAVHLNGVTWVIADSTKPSRMRSLLLHEVGVHHGLESMIGRRRFNTLLKKVGQRVEERLERMRKGEIDADDIWITAHRMADAYAAHADDVLEETIAYAVEIADMQLQIFTEQADRTLVQSLLDGVRRWAASTLGIGQITGRDLHTLAAASLRRTARLAARDAQAPIGPMAYVAVGDVMRFASSKGWDGKGGAASAARFLDEQSGAAPRKRYERDYRKAPKPGVRQAANAAAASAATGAAAVSAVGAATAVKSNQNRRAERKAEYDRLQAEEAEAQRLREQRAAEEAEREARERAIEARDFDALPQMDVSTFETRAAWLKEAAAWVEQWSGVDADYLRALVARETAGTLQPAIRPMRDGKLLSQALGLGQFIPDTWAFEMQRIGPDYGVDLPEGATRQSLRQDEAIQALRENPTLALAITGEHQMENARFMEESLGRPVTAAETYAAHFFGRDKALTFLEGVRRGRDAAWMARTFSPQIKANPFLEGLSAADVMAEFQTDFPGASPYRARPEGWPPLTQSPALAPDNPTPE